MSVSPLPVLSMTSHHGCLQHREDEPSEEERRKMDLAEVSGWMVWLCQSSSLLCCQVRRSLPIYPYREALLEAISEHQV